MSETVDERKYQQLAEARARRRKGPRPEKIDAGYGDPEDLIPDPIVARRYQKHTITLTRWDADPEMGFPLPIVINGKRHRRRGELWAFEQRHVVQRAARSNSKQD
jgi:hypothetical protein